MPITKSAKKALRQAKSRTLRNTTKKTAYKKAVKDFRKNVVAKEIDKAKEQIRLAMQTLDKAAKTNAIKKNKANRLKSRLQKALNKVTA